MSIKLRPTRRIGNTEYGSRRNFGLGAIVLIVLVLPVLLVLSNSASAAVATLTQANYRWFTNADSATPGAALDVQDTAVAIGTEIPLRLRQRVAVDTNDATSIPLKLQYAERSGACDTSFSGETYVDVVGYPDADALSYISRQ